MNCREDEDGCQNDFGGKNYSEILPNFILGKNESQEKAHRKCECQKDPKIMESAQNEKNARCLV